jgi:hypothetical protein
MASLPRPEVTVPELPAIAVVRRLVAKESDSDYRQNHENAIFADPVDEMKRQQQIPFGDDNQKGRQQRQQLSGW